MSITSNLSSNSDSVTELVSITNSGTISGGLSGRFHAPNVSVVNSGTITRAASGYAALSILNTPLTTDTRAAAITIANSGTINAIGSGATALATQALRSGPSSSSGDAPSSIAISNSGTISANGDYLAGSRVGPFPQSPALSIPSVAVAMTGVGSNLSLINTAAGTISASGDRGIAVTVNANSSTFTLDNAGTIRSGSGGAVTDTFYQSGANLALAVTGSSVATTIVNSGTIAGTVVLGDADDSIDNRGTIDGDVFMAGGNDSFTLRASAMVNGIVDGGDGANGLFIDTSNGNTGAAFDLSRFSNFQQVTLIGSGSGSAILAGNLSMPTVALRGGSLDIIAGTTLATTGATTITGSEMAEIVVNRGVVAGSVAMGDGNDRFENHGQVMGAIALDAGDDTYAFYPGATAARVDGGDGIDTLEYHARGTETARDAFSGTGFDNFENLAIAAGVTTIGTENFGRVDVTAGRLIGLANTILSGNVFVAHGATFGSAGTVKGNISIADGGTLSPGASLGVMTINGNLALAAGSTTLFEFVPTGQSDQIIVNGGSVDIKGGSILQFTGTLAPGQSRDLIIVNGGGTISGRFTEDMNHPGVIGALRYTPTMLQLLGTFALPAEANGQQRAAITYVNRLLVANQASPAVLAAFPSLLSNGTTNAAAFGQLTPEAYATAEQFGVEQGLIIAKASRDGAAGTTRSEPGLYSFGQALAGWRSFDGNAAGVSRATSDNFGGLGGVGWGTTAGSIAGFVGYIDGRQRIGALNASTNANGIFAGLTAHVESEAFDVTATAAYNWSRARTYRAVLGNAGANSPRFDLDSLIIDTAIGYSIPVGTGWAVRPTAGFTHISALRGAVTESGGGAFALNVDKRHLKASFADAALSLEGGKTPGAKFHPWIEAGGRLQLDGRNSTASGRFIGTTEQFSVNGTTRPRWLATIGAGLGLDLSRSLRLFTTYRGEFSTADSHNANLGIRFLF